LIKEKQEQIVNGLVNKLGREASEEDNISASSIIQDLLDMKDYYNLLGKRNTVFKLLEFSFTEE
jgi:hypothetical protein